MQTSQKLKITTPANENQPNFYQPDIHSGVYPEFIPGNCSPDSQQGNVSSLAFQFTLSLSPRAAHLARSRGVCAYLLWRLPPRTTPLTYCRGPGVGGEICGFCVKIGKISTFFQPKALIPKQKNQIF